MYPEETFVKKIFFNDVYVWVSACEYVHMDAGTQGGQMCQIPLEPSVWLLGTNSSPHKSHMCFSPLNHPFSSRKHFLIYQRTGNIVMRANSQLSHRRPQMCSKEVLVPVCL